jgi:hypothetical protein
VWAEAAAAQKGSRAAGIRRITAQAERGQVGRSAKSLVAQRALGPGTLRERLGLRRAEGKVKSGALQMLKQRSKAGDRAGTRDALDGVETLRGAGRFSVLERIQASRAKTQAFANSLSAAEKAGGRGDLQRALESHDLATDLRGASHRKVRASAKGLHKSSWDVAQRMADSKNPDGVKQALLFARQAAGRAGVKFNEKKARKLEKQATRGAKGTMNRLVRQSERQYENGDPMGAAQSLAQAIEIQKRFNLARDRRLQQQTARMRAFLTAMRRQ